MRGCLEWLRPVRMNGSVVYTTSTATLGSQPIATVQIGQDVAKQAFTLFADNIVVT